MRSAPRAQRGWSALAPGARPGVRAPRPWLDIPATSRLPRDAQVPIALQHPPFRRYWIGRIVALVGVWTQNTAASLVFLSLTSSAFMIGLINITSAIPMLLLSLFGGVLADRLDHRRILMTTQRNGPFVLHPVALDLGSEPLVGAALIHTFKRWIAESGGDDTGVGSTAAPRRFGVDSGSQSSRENLPMPDVRWTTMLPDLTVLTANVGNGQSPDERLIAAILASKADIVGLQELNRRQAAVLQERLADIYPERFAFADSYEGKAIFSRYPVDSAWPITLVPGRPDCAARIDLGGREITVIVAHPQPPRIQRRGIVSDRRSQRHIVQLGQLAQEAAPAIMLGDFNMTPRHPAYFRFLRLGLHDAFGKVGETRGATFPFRLGAVNAIGPMGQAGHPISRMRLPPVVRYDYVWYTPGFETVEARIGPDTGSDHLPVLARLRLHPMAAGSEKLPY